MKALTILAFICPLIAFLSCNDDDDNPSIYEYHAHIHHPDASVKHLGDTLHIEIEFESHTGEVIHHINVRILNADTHDVVYDLPVDPEVHASVSYTYEDDVFLSVTNDFETGNWVLEASVWGESDGEEEEISSVNFAIQN